MANLGKIARRTFLVGSVAVAGGVAFGYYAVKKPHPNPLRASLGEGEATFNPWVKVSKEGVTLITPHTDIGQGVYSSQAALLAEELDLEFGQFEISPGEPAPAYYNTALAAEGVPYRSDDNSFQAEFMRGTMGALFKVLGVQMTGGSSSVPDSFNKLRLAGAVARETLKKAAEKQTGVAIDQLTTKNGAVVLPDGSTIPYGDLAETAAGIKPVKDVELRPPSEWRLIGKEMPRLDIVAKSTGTAVYGIDLEFDGMLHATVKLNPRRGAVNGYDASSAEAMRGVKKVVPVTGGVAVVADNTWRAFKAMEAIDFDWGAAPYPADQEEHWASLSASMSEEFIDKVWRDDGDVESAIETADNPFEAEYRAPYLSHAPLEPLAAVIKVEEDRVDIWTCSQIPIMLENNVAAITGVDVKNVHLHQQIAGGSFGHRLEDENAKLAAEIGKEFKGQYIKLTYQREEDFAQDFPRQLSIARARGAVADGKIEAIDLEIVSASAFGSQMTRQAPDAPPGPDVQIPAGAWNQPFSIPNFKMTAYRAPFTAPISSWRSVGASSAGFFVCSAIDELIREAGADPMEELLRLVDNDIARKVLEAVGEMSNWGEDLGANQGRGLAFVTSFGVPTAEVVDVTNTEQGIKIDRVFVAAEVGAVVDPVNFENNVQGGVVWGLGHAINCEITYKDGKAEQSNYHDFEGMRLYQCPEIIVRGLENNQAVRGVGEPPVPPAAPALANAIFDATGQRLREMPFNKHIRFV